MTKTTTLTKEEIRHIIKCSNSTVYFVDNFCWLENPSDLDRPIIPFIMGKTKDEPFYYQRDIGEHLDNGENVVAVKSRRVGCSWKGAAHGARLVNFKKGSNCLFLSKNEGKAITLLKKVKFILNNLAYHDSNDYNKATKADFLRNEIIVSNQTTLAIGWRDKNGEITSISTIKSLTSNPDSSIGEGVSFFLLDEWGSLERDAEVWRSVLPTIARGGQYFGASTPRGVGNTFHSVVMSGKNKTNLKADGTPSFYLREVHYTEAGFTKEDISDLTVDSTVDDVDQEWEMKFLQGGRPVFDQIDLAACYKPVKDFPDIKKELDAYQSKVFASENGYHKYYIGVDSALGKQHRKSSEKDYNSLCVLTQSGVQAYAHHTKESISKWAGKSINSGDGKTQFVLGTVSKIHRDFPGDVLIEDNGPGELTFQNHVCPDDFFSTVIRHTTTNKTKNRIIRNLILAIESHRIIITDQLTYDSLLQFQHGSVPGTFEHPVNGQDDPIIALALAWDLLLRHGGLEFSWNPEQTPKRDSYSGNITRDDAPMGPGVVSGFTGEQRMTSTLEIEDKGLRRSIGKVLDALKGRY